MLKPAPVQYKRHPSPLSILLITAGSVLLIETLVMLFLPFVSEPSSAMNAVLDASLLMITLFPLFIFLIYKPFTRVIDDLEESRRRLAASEKEVSAIMRTVGEGIISIDPDSVIKFVNQELCRIFGYSEDELIGKKITMLIPEKYIAPHLKVIKKYIARRVPKILGRKIELEGLRKDGSVFPIEINIKAMELEENLFFTAVISDITERKLASEKILESEERLQSILDNTSAVVYLKDMDGRYILINHTFETLFHIKRWEIAGKTDYDVFPKEMADAFRKNDLRVLKSNKPIEFEEAVPHDDGPHTYISTKFPLHSSSEVPYAVCSISTNITERKRAEEELLAAKEKAEQAIKLKDKYVSLVSHDLKTPLGSMLCFLKLGQDNAVQPLDTNIKEYTNSAIEIGENLLRMIEDLLSISRLKTGEMKADFSFLDAKFFGAKALMLHGITAAQKKIKLINKIKENTRIYADKTLFNEVIQNLVSNAIKFCTEGDSITLFVPDDEPSTIAVKDTGTGIAPQIQADIFDYDKKTSRTGTAGEPGYGFGLPLCKDIMEAHGGDLTVNSTLGEGSAFYAKLPFVCPEVLIVDDDQLSRMEQVRYVKKKEKDINIIEAENGEEALAALEKSRPHLIISDIKMPVMDGFELLKSIKQNKDYRSIPVIVVTGQPGAEIRNRAFRDGADDFVTKPIDPDDYIPRVRRFIS